MREREGESARKRARGREREVGSARERARGRESARESSRERERKRERACGRESERVSARETTSGRERERQGERQRKIHKSSTFHFLNLTNIISYVNRPHVIAFLGAITETTHYDQSTLSRSSINLTIAANAA